ncbi:MAG: multifunctional CCA addition/repair protein, partial [Gammaproteobacteria bacterium]
YAVGGAVRDGLLGRPVKDHDWVVVGASEQALTALGYRKVGADFPVFLHPQTNEEYALARTERKSGHGYKGFVTSAEGVTLEEDLARRDFTINAMARDAAGNLIDPYDGARDLAAGVLRHVTAAFAEDPLRILRGARFAARFDFEIAPETLALMRAMVAAGELATLAPERVWQELARALDEPWPQRFVTVLRACGALAALFPEIDCLFGVPQPARHHPEIDTGEHVLLALAQAARWQAPQTVRFAVLVHDLGKGVTPLEELPSHRGHDVRGVALIEALCARIRAPREHRELACLVSKLHIRAHRALEMKASALLRFLDEADALRRRERFEQLLLACAIDATGRTGFSERPYPQAERLRRAADVAATVDARAIAAQGLAGPALGEAIRAARCAALTRSDT